MSWFKLFSIACRELFQISNPDLPLPRTERDLGNYATIAYYGTQESCNFLFRGHNSSYAVLQAPLPSLHGRHWISCDRWILIVRVTMKKISAEFVRIIGVWIFTIGRIPVRITFWSRVDFWGSFSFSSTFRLRARSTFILTRRTFSICKQCLFRGIHGHIKFVSEFSDTLIADILEKRSWFIHHVLKGRFRHFLHW